MNTKMTTSALALAAVLAAGTASAGAHDGPLKIGVLATLEGTYTVLGEDGTRCLRTAWAATRDMPAGRPPARLVQATHSPPHLPLRSS